MCNETVHNCTVFCKIFDNKIVIHLFMLLYQILNTPVKSVVISYGILEMLARVDCIYWCKFVMYRNNNVVFSSGQLKGCHELAEDHVPNLGAQMNTLQSQVDNLALKQCKMKVATFESLVVSFLLLLGAIIVLLAK